MAWACLQLQPRYSASSTGLAPGIASHRCPAQLARFSSLESRRMIWTIDHALKIVRQLRGDASQQIKLFRLPEHVAFRDDLEQARGALSQAECCLVEARSRLEHRAH
jgi:hypothetical protein